MPERNRDMQRIEEAFARARNELADVGSVRPQVERRIAVMPVKSPRRVLAWSLAACLALLAVSNFLWRRPGNNNQPARESHVNVDPVAQTTQYRSLEIGNTVLIEYLAAFTDQGDVMVIWTCRGDGVVAMPPEAMEIPVRKYRLSNLHTERLTDERTLVCSLMIPDAGVHPMLEPPSIYARSDDNGIIAMSVSPRAASAAELVDAVQSADGGQAGDGVADMIREIQKRIH